MLPKETKILISVLLALFLSAFAFLFIQNYYYDQSGQPAKKVEIKPG